MVKCVFCGREESPHRGLFIIKNDGSINYYCSSKCRKNALKLKRDKKNLKWTNFFHLARERAAVQKRGEQAKEEEKIKAEEKAKMEQKKEEKPASKPKAKKEKK